MAKVAIFTEKQSKHIQFDEDTEVLITYLDKPAALELNKDVDKICKRTGSDWTNIWNQKLGEATIKGWRNINNHDHPGLTLPDGTPIAYNDTNRDMMMKNCREFSIFINETAVDGKAFLEIQQAAAEKADAGND
jgi:hypothetical protein